MSFSSSVEFGSIDATVEGGLEIALWATFKIDESKRLLLLYLKELIQKNYELLDQLAHSPTTTDEEEPHTSDNEDDLSLCWLMTKQKRTSTTGTGDAIIIKLGLDRRLKWQLQSECTYVIVFHKIMTSVQSRIQILAISCILALNMWWRRPRKYL